MGTAFVDIYTQTNSGGKSVQIDTTRKLCNTISILEQDRNGTHSVQVLVIGTSNVLISMDVVSGRNTSALTNIYRPLQIIALNSINCKPKSIIGADDPVFEGARAYLK